MKNMRMNHVHIFWTRYGYFTIQTIFKKNVHDKHMHVNLCAPSIQKLFKNMLSTFSFDITLEYKKEER